MTKYKDNIDEKDLSAFFDDEVSPEIADQVLHKLTQDPQALLKYQRYQLIKDTIRGQGLSADSSLLSGIAEQIEKEQAHNVPVSQQAGRNRQSHVSKAPRNKVLRQHPAMYALAASVFLGVVLVYNPFVKQSNVPVNIASNESPVSEQDDAAYYQQASSNISDAQLRSLRAMLVAHGQFSAAPGLNGLATYSKLVSDDYSAVY